MTGKTGEQPVSVRRVGVLSQPVDVVEALAAEPTLVVVQRDVLVDRGGALELSIAAGAAVSHLVNNERPDTV